ncbi:tRNA 2-thiouridine synthesizing protein A [Methanohalophilus levihalophilus]|uniref:sulfurtransferase TusA family protein n=1 Tax=Methanohalophilus levihalophilus TaxID=1431282 RepID=UPI001AE8E6E8|nr:sulfurtransferase TusA family protein [Methanohalophilus levihalophilus]MBP2031269.1 tRNA 2-thiouridine synthesizing protein A [Methanohalophilus levihalophilus]
MVDIIADFELDVKGQCCPYPLVKVKEMLDTLEKDEVLMVISDDPMTPQNIVAWTKKSGDVLISIEKEGDVFTIYVKKN